MNAINSGISELISSYKHWVQCNPQLLADLESTVRCFSYFTAGRYNNSTLASELIYSIPNLIELFNDLLISGGKYMNSKIPKLQLKINIWLTVLEYTEALFEVSAHRIWGKSGKWLIITFIQIFKAVMRLCLIHVYKENVIKSPSIKPLNKKKINQADDKDIKMKEGFQLKRSGIVVRSIKTSRSIETRVWTPISSMRDENENVDNAFVSKRMLMLAETLYIIKPLFHLGCLSATGKTNWQPWFLSLIIDLSSLQLFSHYGKAAALNKEEWNEIYQRKLSILLYILRSPFYDTYSRLKIITILNILSKKVPLAKLLTEPIEKYLPHWQQMYFYMWSR
ncbi:peroxisomal membrane protein PEX16 [Polistes fuscatus]|uniref:peroxisomal membrane protein PEX16 n=1 Tax=Polistes fuscatus TaxID=30207 RepID=UPI001CAA339A|nr:peroxisomal membrane protein PEX16 [Polistes fuscatus]XP_043494718.1 peroxisomal membrane protein PEX16 [Polistes fuscatus]